MTRSGAKVVLVHGAWHRAACWNKVMTELAALGIPVVAIDLPFEGFESDAAAARAAIVAAGPDAVVVGHSYGGAVISAAASGLPNVRHLVYLCAFMLADDEGMDTITADYPLPLFDHLRVVDGVTTIDPAAAAAVFYGDCSPADAGRAVEQLRPMPWSAPAASSRPAWRDVPSTYVLCTEDAAVVPALQRHMARHASEVVEWPTSHSPFLSAPERIVALLAQLTGA